MGKFFGTDGFRGEANVELNARHAFNLGCFLAEYCKERVGKGEGCRIAVGKDPRRSSYMFEYALAAGITACGADACLLHVTTTPSISYVVRTDGFDCGVMISASHNAYHDNGIKILSENGEKMDEEGLALAEEYLQNNLPPAFVTGEKIGRTVDYSEGRNRYIGYLISLSRFSYRGLKVGLDCANGSAFSLASSVFAALGAQVYAINASPNGLNINEGCGSTHPEALTSFVKNHALDIGFAFDGDADRCFCVDEKGGIIDGDGILYMSAKYLKKHGELAGDKVICTVMSNGGLEAALQKENILCERVPVGDKYVHGRMRQTNAVLGGEPSGHVIFGKYATTGDGILTAIKVMEIMLGEKKKASELTKGYVPYPQVLFNLPLRDKSVCELPCVRGFAQSLQNKEGVKILLRPSGTENVARILCEGKNLFTCQKVVNLLKEFIVSVQRELLPEKE